MDILQKYYIYTSLDKITNSYRGLISYENNMKSLTNKGWKIQEEFYAVNPYLRPIPTGMKLFSCEIKNYYPYDISTYKLLYDIYEVDRLKDKYHVNLITYNRPVLNSIPLYFYQFNEHIFPSFSDKPPNSEYNLVLGVNPIFVLKDKNVSFHCGNGICFPEPVPSINMNPFTEDDDNSLSFSKCLNFCNSRGKSILDTIYDLSNKNSLKNHYIVIAVIAIVLLIIIFILRTRFVA